MTQVATPQLPKQPAGLSLLRHRVGAPGRWALGLFAVHVVLLALPPIPPDVKGSLWSYLLAAAIVLLGCLEVRAHRTRPARWWFEMAPSTRRAVGGGVALTALSAGLFLRALSPELFTRWARPEGVFEPLSMLAYLVGALVLYAQAHKADLATRRHLSFLGLGFVLLFMEEIDYFGAFGGMIGRINGVYVGTPHDLINLALQGHFTLWMGMLAVAVVAGATFALLRARLLQPKRLVQTLTSPAGWWFLAGAVVISMAQLEDLGLFHFLGTPAIEELLEMTAAWLWLCFGLEVAAREGVAVESATGQ